MSALSTPEAVALSFAAQCDCGKVRAENQDSVRQCATPLGDLLMVADGIGGYEGGGVASRMAVNAIAAALEGMPAFFPIDIAIEEAICRANAEIVAAAAVPDTPNNRMGSTIVLALLQQNAGNPKAPVQAWIGHIGDSRAYHLREGRLTGITRDHSAIQLLLDHDLVSPEEARNHPDASVLTRTLGHEQNVKVELNSVELGPGDTLLLCSDGLWGYVSDPAIERVLADPRLTAEQASRALLDLALEAGGHDNVGIQLARLAGSGAAVAEHEPAPAYEADTLPEQLRAYLLIEEPPALWLPSSAQSESPVEPPFESAVVPSPISAPEFASAPLTISEAAPVDFSAAPVDAPAEPVAPAANYLTPVVEFLHAPVAEPRAALAEEIEVTRPGKDQTSDQTSNQTGHRTSDHANDHFDSQAYLQLESARELQLAQTQTPETQIAASEVSETQVDQVQSEQGRADLDQTREEPLEEFKFPEDDLVDLHAFEWRNTKLVVEPAKPEEKVTTILNSASDLWEMFVYPLGRDYDFAPEWHVDFNSIYENIGEDKTVRQSTSVHSLVAGVLVACASPKRDLASITAQDSHLSARFKSSTNDVSTLLKFLGILLLGFCTSCGLVYCALFQNWFGIDQILHLR